MSEKMTEWTNEATAEDDGVNPKRSKRPERSALHEKRRVVRKARAKRFDQGALEDVSLQVKPSDLEKRGVEKPPVADMVAQERENRKRRKQIATSDRVQYINDDEGHPLEKKRDDSEEREIEIALASVAGKSRQKTTEDVEKIMKEGGLETQSVSDENEKDTTESAPNAPEPEVNLPEPFTEPDIATDTRDRTRGFGSGTTVTSGSEDSFDTLGVPESTIHGIEYNNEKNESALTFSSTAEKQAGAIPSSPVISPAQKIEEVKNNLKKLDEQPPQVDKPSQPEKASFTASTDLAAARAERQVRDSKINILRDLRSQFINHSIETQGEVEKKQREGDYAGKQQYVETKKWDLEQAHKASAAIDAIYAGKDIDSMDEFKDLSSLIREHEEKKTAAVPAPKVEAPQTSIDTEHVNRNDDVEAFESFSKDMAEKTTAERYVPPRIKIKDPNRAIGVSDMIDSTKKVAGVVTRPVRNVLGSLLKGPKNVLGKISSKLRKSTESATVAVTGKTEIGPRVIRDHELEEVLPPQTTRVEVSRVTPPPPPPPETPKKEVGRTDTVAETSPDTKEISSFYKHLLEKDGIVTSNPEMLGSLEHALSALEKSNPEKFAQAKKSAEIYKASEEKITDLNAKLESARKGQVPRDEAGLKFERAKRIKEYVKDIERATSFLPYRDEKGWAGFGVFDKRYRKAVKMLSKMGEHGAERTTVGWLIPGTASALYDYKVPLINAEKAIAKHEARVEAATSSKTLDTISKDIEKEKGVLSVLRSVLLDKSYEPYREFIEKVKADVTRGFLTGHIKTNENITALNELRTTLDTLDEKKKTEHGGIPYLEDIDVPKLRDMLTGAIEKTMRKGLDDLLSKKIDSPLFRNLETVITELIKKENVGTKHSEKHRKIVLETLAASRDKYATTDKPKANLISALISKFS